MTSREGKKKQRGGGESIIGVIIQACLQTLQHHWFSCFHCACHYWLVKTIFSSHRWIQMCSQSTGGVSNLVIITQNVLNCGRISLFFDASKGNEPSLKQSESLLLFTWACKHINNCKTHASYCTCYTVKSDLVTDSMHHCVKSSTSLLTDTEEVGNGAISLWWGLSHFLNTYQKT